MQDNSFTTIEKPKLEFYIEQIVYYVRNVHELNAVDNLQQIWKSLTTQTKLLITQLILFVFRQTCITNILYNLLYIIMRCTIHAVCILFFLK